ncbi:hypothetical protein [Arthrobacter sp. FW306-2-2C-D06B]|uniref:hypothetical protein n=1 Tax=Arthrobacter sp. FW306-2-2C-D06B TaxID=2879618 RepID=UPI001F30216C|nr:hypothetical protein [Arthrobacter sp. FW306-2-2C-D06B]UKA59291.1 hypothetical protein LFT47_02750 [Arthrobacter sp. FW306-2-2C-D06B]
MIGPTLLLMVGLVDLVGAVRLGRSLVARLLFLVAISVLVISGFGMCAAAVLACAALAFGWTLAMSPSKPPARSPDGSPSFPTPRLWPVIVLFVLVFGITAYDRTAGVSAGFLLDAYSLIALKSASSISLETVISAGAVAIFLVQSANLVTLAALGRAHQEDAAQGSAGRGKVDPVGAEPLSKWELYIRSSRVASIRPGEKPKPGSSLKGGRLIGPIERLLIVVLAFAGAPQIIAALAAAKGIVRFPEISEDRGSGSKAEEFLVGSLASWTLSAIAVLYLTLVRNG